MGSGRKIPDAWDDDDWESQADRLVKEEAASSPSEPTDEAVATTRSERLARHAEEQRKLWEAACVRESVQ